MADGSQCEAWNHTAHLTAWLIMTTPFRKDKKFVQPYKFHPFYRDKPPVKKLSRQDSITRLHQMFGTEN